MSKLREQLYILCCEYLNKREGEIKHAIAEAQEAANNETKSSAGDKFETGREVMQQDIELNMVRLSELNKSKITLEQIIPAQNSQVVIPGCVVITNNGNFYIAISAGQLKFESVTYYAVSIASPIGAKMAGQTKGYAFSLNGKNFEIEKVY